MSYVMLFIIRPLRHIASRQGGYASETTEVRQ
jgi:hypothetical protein